MLVPYIAQLILERLVANLMIMEAGLISNKTTEIEGLLMGEQHSSLVAGINKHF